MTNDLQCIYGESYKPIVVNPVMAYALGGANDAMVFTQIDYWLDVILKDTDRYQDSFKEGHWWTYQTYSSLMEQLPFLSKKTIQNIINRLIAKGVLIVGRFGQGRFNSTNYYRIDYNKVRELYQAAEKEVAEKTKKEAKKADSDKRGWQNVPPREGGKNYHQGRVAKSTTNREYNLENKHKESNTKLAVSTADDADDFNFSFLDQEVYKVCREMPLPLRCGYDIMDKYYRYYYDRNGFCNRIGYDTLLSSFERLQSAIERNGIEWADVPQLIPLYFSTEFREDIDYGFPHFCSDKVLDILIRRYKRECLI